MLVAGTVKMLPTSVPKVPAGFPETPAFVSVHEAELTVKFVARVSVICTWVPVVVTGMGVGDVG